ncbi:sodium-independent sulfate anion transporter-like [Glandiceps talaboti]
MGSRRKGDDRTVKEKISDYAKESCSVENWKVKFPISFWLPKYRPKWVVSDCIAGLTVGLTVIPQGLAYATVAKLPVEYGLYSAFMGCIVYCLMGTSKDISLGPTAVMSLMVAEFGGGDGESELNDPIYAIILAFFSGIILFLMGLFNLGFVINFISFPVINAFTSGAAVIIGFSQLRHIFGIPKFKSHGFVDDVYNVSKGLPQTRWQDFVMGFTCFVLLMAMKFVKDKYNGKKATSKAQLILYKTIWLLGTARNAVIVILAACVAYAVYASGHQDAFKLVGFVPEGLPPFQSPVPPFLRLMEETGVAEEVNHTLANLTHADPTLHTVAGHMTTLISNTTADMLGDVTTATEAFVNATVAAETVGHTGRTYLGIGEVLGSINVGLAIIPIIGFLENCAIAKAFGRKNNYRIYPNQELLALGTANVLSSFVSAYPVTGSFSRTAVNAQSGVKTPLGGVFTAGLVLLSLAFLTPLFFFIPKAALGAVIICAVIAMFDHTVIKQLWIVKKMDLFVWVATFLGCLGLGVEFGVIIGVLIDLGILLFSHAKPNIEVKKREVPVFQIDQGIHYPAVEHIYDTFKDGCLTGDTKKSCIADCSRISFIDYTSVQAIKEMCVEFKRNNVKIVMAGMQPDILETISKAKVPNFENYDTVEDAMKALLEDQPEVLASHVILTPIGGKLDNNNTDKRAKGGDAV